MESTHKTVNPAKGKSDINVYDELQGVTRIEMSQRLTNPSVETPGALRKSELSI